MYTLQIHSISLLGYKIWKKLHDVKAFMLKSQWCKQKQTILTGVESYNFIFDFYEKRQKGAI